MYRQNSWYLIVLNFPQTYMKFIGVPVRVREANNPFFTPKGRLPVMKDGRKLLTNFEEVVDHLKSLVKL